MTSLIGLTVFWLQGTVCHADLGAVGSQLRARRPHSSSGWGACRIPTLQLQSGDDIPGRFRVAADWISAGLLRRDVVTEVGDDAGA